MVVKRPAGLLGAATGGGSGAGGAGGRVPTTAVSAGSLAAATAPAPPAAGVGGTGGAGGKTFSVTTVDGNSSGDATAAGAARPAGAGIAEATAGNSRSIASSRRASASAVAIRRSGSFANSWPMTCCNSAGTSGTSSPTGGGSSSRCFKRISGSDLPRNGGRRVNST